MKTFIIPVLFCSFFISCFTPQMKKQMNEGLKQSQKMMAGMNFIHAINYIEVYKLRNGEYPESLSQIKFTSEFDGAVFSSLEYQKLDSGYVLNTVMRYSNMNGAQDSLVKLNYP